jgi:hypothetical protein
MKPINELHLTEPGLVVVDVAAADDRTAFADRSTRAPGQPGVRLRCDLDLRQDVAIE